MSILSSSIEEVCMPEEMDLFIVLRGDHPTLPRSELGAIGEAEGVKITFKASPIMIQRCRTGRKGVEAIAERGYYTRYILEELAYKKSSPDLLSYIQDIGFREHLEGGDFRVSIRSLKGAADESLLRELRVKIIDHIKGETGSEHTLFHPDCWFRGYLSEDWFIFGRLLKGTRMDIGSRRPHQRPSFHPSSLQPRVAGCMVNLSRARRDGVFLDPFCGAGSTLIEAGFIGCTPVGLDISKSMTEAAKRNLSHYSRGNGGVVRGDARRSPLLPVDSIATDPPYGRTTTVLGEELHQLYRDFLESSCSILREGGYLCIAAPDYIQVSEPGLETGFKHIESHFIRVHGSLTREIAVLQR
ncbi:MAG: hypothetical protein ACLFVP_04200 [Candidatus Bathyarchaeia archaeon]